jgi:hypothetical protein
MASRMLLSTAALTATATPEVPPSKRSATELPALVGEPVADVADALVPELGVVLGPEAAPGAAADAEPAAAPRAGVVPRS